MALLKSRKPARKKRVAEKPRDFLCFVVCGSAGSGKSTLIGRLVAETGPAPEDRLAPPLPNNAAYRHFGTGTRAFAAADTPGHEQSARDMMCGALSAGVAVVVVDARAGITDAAMRHSRIAALLGIREIALVVNAMDLAHYSEKAFDSVTAAYREFAASLGALRVTAIPVAARSGDNVAVRSKKMRWYKGPSVLEYLEAADAASGGEAVTDPKEPAEVSDQFAAHVVWFGETPLLPGRGYSLRMGAQTVAATVTSLRHKIELATGAEEAGHNLALNEIGFCNLATIEPVVFDACAGNRATGTFILIDRMTGMTAGAGMVAFALRRASNIRHQHYEVGKDARAALKSQRPCIVWFTGLPSAGKSTVMNLVEQRLHRQGVHTYSLDGDNLRGGLTRDLGFTDADRVENIRRAGEVAKLMVDAGLVVLCAFVSPFRAERRMVRELVSEGEFVEVFVDTPLEICIARDPKGLYRKAREGKVFHVTGIDSPYEPPERAEIHLEPAAGRDAGAQADAVLAELIRRGIAG